jgi:HEAT repeat protein
MFMRTLTGHVGLVVFLLVCGCNPPAPSPAQADAAPPVAAQAEVAPPPPEPMPGTARLLAVAEDTGRGYDERVNAIKAIGRLGDRSAVPRLLRLAAPMDDVVVLAAIHALGDIGDPGALPGLQGFCADRSVGKISGVKGSGV